MNIYRLTAVLTGVLATPAVACDLCAVYSAAQARGEIGAGIFAGVAEQFTHFGTVQVDGTEVPNTADQYLDSSITQLFAGYNFNDRVGLQFNLPLIYRSFTRPDGLGGMDSGHESGLGDVSLLASFAAYQRETEDYHFRWQLLGGVKLPTGSTDRIAEEFDEVEDPVGPASGIHGHDLTLGTGSVDGIVGTGVSARWKRWFVAGGVQYAIRSEGDFDYQFANDLTWSVGPGYYLLLSEARSLALQLVVSGEDKGLDTFQGADAGDTGITSVFIGPQINFTWSEHLSAQAGMDLPLHIDNTDLQTVPDYRVRAGVSWHF